MSPAVSVSDAGKATHNRRLKMETPLTRTGSGWGSD
jgi:hypothetical protein